MKGRRWFFTLYCAVMLWLLFGQRIGFVLWEDYRQQLLDNLNLQPFDTIGRYFWVLQNSEQRSALTHAFVNLAGNVAMFIPLGYFLPRLWHGQKRFWVFFVTVLGLILAVELVQLVTLLGKCDVDDVLLNLTGAVLGFLFHGVLTKFSKN